MAKVNRQITLASRPVGIPAVSNFHLVYSPMPSPAEDEVLVRSLYLSLDPDIRGRMGDAESSTVAPLAIGEVIAGGAVGFVVQSNDANFRPGDAVEGMLGWQEYGVVRGRDLRKLDPGIAPISTALGVLGVPGLTAFFGLLEICDPQPGETVVISGAEGAVGMLVGQLAKIMGCRAVGVAGSGARISWLLDELGFDAALSYEMGGGFESRLRELCPDGIDIYFDNVGGTITDEVMRQINTGARISVCGQVSQDNLEQPELGPRWLNELIAKQAKMQGFLISGFAERFPAACEKLAGWLKQGKLKYREEVAQGIEAAPQAFIAMLQGKNEGKLLVQLAES